MDVKAAKTAVAAVRTAVKELVDAEIKNRSFNGLRALAGADTLLSKTEERLDDAVRLTTPKAKKAAAPAKAGK